MDNLPVEVTPTPEFSKADKVRAVVALAKEIGADLLLLNGKQAGDYLIYDADGDVFEGGALIHIVKSVKEKPSQE